MAKTFVTATCPHCGTAFPQEVDTASGHRPGGVTYAVYEYVRANPHATRNDALDWAKAQGYNPLTVLTQFGHARRELGLTRK